ncbi:hypothetical protein G3I13_16310 [Streptomyces sp. SID6673]|nr:hypothetical protein [Streptomyces sp. SID11726]NEB25900.1 hypothetical protein [Streptomyces sp. SID6673]
MSSTTALVIAGYVARVASGALSALIAGRLSARNARQDRLHAMRVDACSQAMEYAQIVLARLDRVEDEYWSGPEIAALPHAQPIFGRLDLLVPSAARHFADVVRVYDEFTFDANENLQPYTPASANETKPTRDACEALVESLRGAVS